MSGASQKKMWEIADAWQDACRSLDNEKIVSLLTDNATVWYNFEPKTTHDRASYRDLLNGSDKTFRNRRYKDVRIHVYDGGFVEQATLEGDTDKGVVAAPFLLVASVADGKITRLNQYFDSTILRQAGLSDS